MAWEFKPKGRFLLRGHMMQKVHRKQPCHLALKLPQVYGTTVSSSLDYEAARRHGRYVERYLRNGSRSTRWHGGGHRARSTRSTMYPTCPCSRGTRVKRGKRRRNGIYWSSVSCESTVDFQWVRRSSKLAYRWCFRRWWWVGLIIAIYLLLRSYYCTMFGNPRVCGWIDAAAPISWEQLNGLQPVPNKGAHATVPAGTWGKAYGNSTTHLPQFHYYL